jgi:F-type H+-transporting ATPase subunit a
MGVNPDKAIVFALGPIAVNETIFFTWIVMALLMAGTALATRPLTQQPGATRSQHALEALLGFLEDQIAEVAGGDPRPFLPFLGSLFVFILAANVLEIVPLYHAPTASLSTTAALALCVFFAVPAFAVRRRGLRGFLREYIEPSVIMLPFHIIGEISRTISLAVRLFGNVMSEGLIAAVLLSIAPLFVPVLMQGFGLLIGTIQAYIFFTLATVYVCSAAGAGDRLREEA